ncbi:MAG TPA: methyltransferase domain-containing protein [Trebonia sp.]|nr:methyltransferase domain-containing protein [Trebonia sp.]
MECMPPVTRSSAESASQAAANDYDSFAEAYSAENEVNLHNAYYERPAMLALAGDVAGRRILDAGCGSGPLSAALRDRGAIVTGFDSSAGMLELARRRLGGDADLRVADLASPLPYPAGAFDDVIASLVLHYLEDWTAPLAELRRVLRPGGRLLASVNHPIAGHALVRPGAEYFSTYLWSEEMTTAGGQSYVLANWHRPLPAMISAFTGAGFRIAAIEEPLPAPDTPRELLPDFLKDRPAGSGFLCFMFFVLEAD